MPTRVVVESGSKRVFASALDWPGWSRSAKTAEAALEALAEYAPRYADTPKAAAVRFPANVADSFDVVETLRGNATTDFGAPGIVADAEHVSLTARQAARIADLVVASWQVLDRISKASPAELRKGPRGGGRDRDKMRQHVVSAEAGYARYLGVRHREPAFDDRRAVQALRADIEAALRAARAGLPDGEKGWPACYAARRIAWHVLDHAWEMEDKRT